MESPYAPPQAPEPLLKKRAGKGARITTRILGLLAVVGAGALFNFFRRFSEMGREIGIYDPQSARLLLRLLLWNDGLLPFLAAVALALAGIALSFWRRGRALPMLALVVASSILSVVTFVALNLLILEFVRVTGGA